MDKGAGSTRAGPGFTVPPMRSVLCLFALAGCVSDGAAFLSSAGRLVGRPEAAAIDALGPPTEARRTGDGAVLRWRSRDLFGVQTGTGSLVLPLDCEIDVRVGPDGLIAAATMKGDYGACETYQRALDRAGGLE